MSERPFHDVKMYGADGTLVATFEHVDEEFRDELIQKTRMVVGARIEILCTCTR